MANNLARAKTDLADTVAGVVSRCLKNGWSASRIAVGMEQLGHAGWNENIVYAVTRARNRRILTLDEGVSLLAVVSAQNRVITRELEKATARLEKKHQAS